MSQFVSLFLCARPSFLEGFARLLDIGGTLNGYNSSIDGAQADRLALRADLTALRRDLARVRAQLRHGHRQENTEPLDQ